MFIVRKYMSEDLIKKVAEAPAATLDATVGTGQKIADSISSHTHIQKAKDYWKNLGPGLTTGASDDDPSGIATYSQTGAQYGFQLLWLAGFTFPLMSVVQEMCARIGLVTGRGLAGNIRVFFPKWVLLTATLCLFAANSLNIGANLGAMAKSVQMLFPALPFFGILVGFTLISILLQIYTTYDKYAKYLKWLALILVSYIFAFFTIPNMDWVAVLKGSLIPTIDFSKEQIILICAILGTTISPYLFFWQTSQEVEEQILEGKTTLKLRQEETTQKEINDMRTDVWSGMFLSNAVMFFIIAACAATLFPAGITQIQSAEQAAAALRPIAGDSAYILFALGIIGTGLLSIPVLAGSASYALSESFGWKSGLFRKLHEARAFYGVIIISTFIGLLINLIGFDVFQVLIYTAVVNGLIAPLILATIIIIASDKKVMGKWASGPVAKTIGWIITVLMAIAGVAAVWALVTG
jgi:NRAMP (natural resistance-associated macrophage protein)-like metal ion transporter